MEDVIRYQTEGAILRSKVKWYNEGERNTKYFHSLERLYLGVRTCETHGWRKTKETKTF